VQLVIRNSVADTWDFVVEREKSTDTEPVAGEQPPPYAKGDFSVSMLNSPALDAFNHTVNPNPAKRLARFPEIPHNSRGTK
jgi:hypothetical protein